MSDLNTALQTAAQAHAGQHDKQGGPYITHPLRVMAGCSHPLAQIVAVLHDVVEDTATTFDDLRRQGFSEEILEALRCVTHEKHVSYAEYVIRCKANPLAREVKLADLRDNSRLDRALLRPDRAESDLARLHRYVLSHHYLTDLISEADYRRLMSAYSGEAGA